MITDIKMYSQKQNKRELDEKKNYNFNFNFILQNQIVLIQSLMQINESITVLIRAMSIYKSKTNGCTIAKYSKIVQYFCLYILKLRRTGEGSIGAVSLEYLFLLFLFIFFVVVSSVPI